MINQTDEILLISPNISERYFGKWCMGCSKSDSCIGWQRSCTQIYTHHRLSFGLLRNSCDPKLHHPSVIHVEAANKTIWFGIDGVLSASTLRDLMKEDTEGSGQIVL